MKNGLQELFRITPERQSSVPSFFITLANINIQTNLSNEIFIVEFVLQKDID